MTTIKQFNNEELWKASWRCKE